jgi:chromosome segregation ATPase
LEELMAALWTRLGEIVATADSASASGASSSVRVELQEFDRLLDGERSDPRDVDFVAALQAQLHRCLEAVRADAAADPNFEGSSSQEIGETLTALLPVLAKTHRNASEIARLRASTLSLRAEADSIRAQIAAEREATARLEAEVAANREANARLQAEIAAEREATGRLQDEQEECDK